MSGVEVILLLQPTTMFCYKSTIMRAATSVQY